MSSLLQFGGQTNRKLGVNLQFTLDRDVTPEDNSPFSTVDAEPYTCGTCGRSHALIWTAWRKPVGMLGAWVVFRYNGEENVPDLSIPIRVNRIPRGAVQLTEGESSAIWHS